SWARVSTRFSSLHSYFSLPTEVRVRARLATPDEIPKTPHPETDAGFFLWPWTAGMPGLSRRSMASEALGLLPGEMQEQFPTDAQSPRYRIMSQNNEPHVTPKLPERIRVFDTTLRDGEQAPGFSMTKVQKLRMGHALADLGVDVIEAGFPQASDGDFESVRAVASEIRGPTICGLA